MPPKHLLRETFVIAICRGLRPARESIHHDRSNRFALVHQVEALVDVGELELVRDQVVDVDLALHVPVDDFRYVAPALGAAERGALPYAAGDELERARPDLLARARDADDHRHPPALVAALERLAHHLDVADAFEAVVGAALGQVHQVRDQVLAGFLGIDEMRHAELLGEVLSRRIEIHADDHVCAGEARALHDVEPDAAETEYHHVGARLDLGGVDHRADAGGHAAADVAHLVERGVFADLGQRDLGHHGVVGKSRSAHVVEQLLAPEREAAAAVGHHALPLRGTYRLAQIGLAAQAVFALPALRGVERNDVIAFFHAADAGPRIDHHACALVAENRREQAFGVRARAREFVGMADAGRLDLDQYFSGLRPLQLHGFYGERCACLMSDRRANVHALLPVELSMNRNTAHLWNACRRMCDEYRVFAEALC